MPHAPSDEYLSKFYEFQDFIVENYEEHEKDWGIKFSEVMNSRSSFIEFLNIYYHRVSKYWDIKEEIWGGDMDGIIWKILEHYYSKEQRGDLAKELGTLIISNYFRKNRSKILEKIYAGEDITDNLLEALK